MLKSNNFIFVLVLVRDEIQLRVLQHIFLITFSVLAISEQGGLLSAPDTYMEKIVIGSNLPKNLMDVDYNNTSGPIIPDKQELILDSLHK